VFIGELKQFVSSDLMGNFGKIVFSQQFWVIAIAYLYFYLISIMRNLQYKHSLLHGSIKNAYFLSEFNKEFNIRVEKTTHSMV
jgi:lipid-A-disaccharide synthase-like uncharacterized protein